MPASPEVETLPDGKIIVVSPLSLARFNATGARLLGTRFVMAVPRPQLRQLTVYMLVGNPEVLPGFAEESLEKRQPSGTLGHFVADAMLFSARKAFNMPLDAAFVNYGGQRITQMPKGPVTRSTIFELMPFENVVVVQSMKGDVLQEFLDHIAKAGGWPVAGITFQIRDKKAVNVLVNGVPLDNNKTYHIVNSDYVASGGDYAAMLKDIPQQNRGYLMRDAIFDYIKTLKAEGKNISAQKENRITHAQ